MLEGSIPADQNKTFCQSIWALELFSFYSLRKTNCKLKKVKTFDNLWIILFSQPHEHELLHRNSYINEKLIIRWTSFQNKDTFLFILMTQHNDTVKQLQEPRIPTLEFLMNLQLQIKRVWTCFLSTVTADVVVVLQLQRCSCRFFHEAHSSFHSYDPCVQNSSVAHGCSPTIRLHRCTLLSLLLTTVYHCVCTEKSHHLIHYQLSRNNVSFKVSFKKKFLIISNFSVDTLMEQLACFTVTAPFTCTKDINILIDISFTESSLVSELKQNQHSLLLVDTMSYGKNDENKSSSDVRKS